MHSLRRVCAHPQEYWNLLLTEEGGIEEASRRRGMENKICLLRLGEATIWQHETNLLRFELCGRCFLAQEPFAQLLDPKDDAAEREEQEDLAGEKRGGVENLV